MRRKEAYPLEKVTLNLREGDFDRLQILHGRLGAGKVIRELVIRHIKRVDNHVSQAVPSHAATVLPTEELK
jgi:hypothetical protein